MSELSELFQQGNCNELWQRCCGFIDLNPRNFMRVQQRLLFEQLELLQNCQLGRAIMKGADPRNLDEFRTQIGLTNYSDYVPYLQDKREETLPRKPALWHYTSGKSGEYSFRWAPVTAEQLNEIEPLIFALLLFASCEDRGVFTVKPGDRVFYGMAPPPYATGTMTRAFPHALFDFSPPINQAETMSFEDRVNDGFLLSLSKGLDICFAMSSVAVAIGERFSQKGRSTSPKALLKRPRALMRLASGLLASKLAGRHLLPRDIWSLKGLITYGIDGSIFREKIREMWGRYPLDFHGCTEAIIIAMQTWDYEGMTFVPNLNFFEFIPEDEALKSTENAAYKPRTYFIDEIRPGNYELVITNFHGGPFIRYRTGHLIRITSLRNEKLNIDIPQMTFLSRIDDQIDIAGFTRLSERAIWQAIENSGFSYVDWTVRKEVKAGNPVLHLYIELRAKGDGTSRELVQRIHEELKKLDPPYAELEAFTGLKPVEVTILPQEAFSLYRLRQQISGADIAHLKPPHLNPSDEILNSLLAPRYVTKSTEKVPA